jgi:hypothetical protein
VVLVVCCCCDQKVQWTVAFFLSFSFGHLGSNIPFLAVAFSRRFFYSSFFFSFRAVRIYPPLGVLINILRDSSRFFWRNVYNFFV